MIVEGRSLSSWKRLEVGEPMLVQCFGLVHLEASCGLPSNVRLEKVFNLPLVLRSLRIAI